MPAVILTVLALYFVCDFALASHGIRPMFGARWKMDPRLLCYVSAGALAVAGRNAQSHGVADRVRLVQGFLLRAIPQPVDIITANLPYIPTHDIDRLAPEIAAFEPRQALDGGYYGLQLIGEFLNQAPHALRPGGVVLLEIGSDQGEVVVGLARRAFPQADVRLVRDFAVVRRR